MTWYNLLLGDIGKQMWESTHGFHICKKLNCKCNRNDCEECLKEANYKEKGDL